jgi:alpha-ribazole phosphatase
VDTVSAVLFIRHGETAMAGRFCGHTDPPLNQQGQAQAAALAASLAEEPIAQVYSSDLRRARETAEALVLSRGLPVEQRPALREMYFGQWEGLSWDEIESLDPEYAGAWVSGFPQLPAPSGEHFSEFTARVLNAVQAILDRHHDVTAVVTHAGVLRVVLAHLFACSEAEAWAQTKPYCCVLRYARKTLGETQ